MKSPTSEVCLLERGEVAVGLEMVDTYTGTRSIVEPEYEHLHYRH